MATRRNRGHYKPQVEALNQKVAHLERALVAALGASRGDVDMPSPPEQPSISPLPNSSEHHGPSTSYFDHMHSMSVHTDHHQKGVPLSYANLEALLHPARLPLVPSRPHFPFLAALGLTPSIVDYLCGLYFHRYQIPLRFVNQHEFMAQRARGYGPMMRESLFLAMLTISLRYNTRPAIHRTYIRADGENILAIAAKKALERELQNRDIVTLKALLILTEVETTSGHDMSAYMYSTMASRLIFELGLDVCPSPNPTLISSEDLNSRHWILLAASIGDQYWAINLRKPITIKSHMLQFSRLNTRFELNKSEETQPLGDTNFEHQVDENLLDLLELSREITDSLYRSHPSELPSIVQNLYSRLQQWHAFLPTRIRGGPLHGNDSYHFYFVLHILYNANIIVLFRDKAVTLNSRTLLAQQSTIATLQIRLTSAAIQIAKLFETFRHREDLRRLQSTGTQWAALATYALIDNIGFLNVSDFVEAVAHLQSLARTLKEMQKTFHAATQVHQHALRNLEIFTRQLNGSESPPVFYQDAPISEELSSPRLANSTSEVWLRDESTVMYPLSVGMSVDESNPSRNLCLSVSTQQEVGGVTIGGGEYVSKLQCGVNHLDGEDRADLAPSVVPESLAEPWNWDYVSSHSHHRTV